MKTTTAILTLLCLCGAAVGQTNIHQGQTKAMVTFALYEANGFPFTGPINKGTVTVFSYRNTAAKAMPVVLDNIGTLGIYGPVNDGNGAVGAIDGNMPGMGQLQMPNAWVAAGATELTIDLFCKDANIFFSHARYKFDLTGYDPNSPVGFAEANWRDTQANLTIIEANQGGIGGGLAAIRTALMTTEANVVTPLVARLVGLEPNIVIPMVSRFTGLEPNIVNPLVSRAAGLEANAAAMLVAIRSALTTGDANNLSYAIGSAALRDSNWADVRNVLADLRTRAPLTEANLQVVPNWLKTYLNLDGVGDANQIKTAANAAAVGSDPNTIAGQVWNSQLASYGVSGSAGAGLATAAAAGAGTDPNTVAAVFLRAPVAPYSVAGNMAHLMTVAGAGAGLKPYIRNVVVGVTVIEGAVVRVTTDSTGSTKVTEARTDAFGKAYFWLQPGTYYFWVNKSGYSWTNPEPDTVNP